MEPRTTSSGESITVFRFADGSSITERRSFDACSPSKYSSIRTLVSGGRSRSMNAMSLKPMTERSSGHDSPMEWWDVKTGKRLHVNQERQTWNGDLTYFPDGKKVATGTYGGDPIALWDSVTGKPLHDLDLRETNGYVCGLCFSSDNKKLMAGTTSAAKTVTLTNNLSTALTIGFSASGDYAAVGGGTTPCGTSLAGKAKQLGRKARARL